jgi:hypothetical protein
MHGASRINPCRPVHAKTPQKNRPLSNYTQSKSMNRPELWDRASCTTIEFLHGTRVACPGIGEKNFLLLRRRQICRLVSRAVRTLKKKDDLQESKRAMCAQLGDLSLAAWKNECVWLLHVAAGRRATSRGSVSSCCWHAGTLFFVQVQRYIDCSFLSTCSRLRHECPL